MQLTSGRGQSRFGVQKKGEIFIWGVIDQLVHQNIRLNREGDRGASNPGILTISMEGPGDLAIYQGNLFLAGLQQDHIISTEYDALESSFVKKKIAPYLDIISKQITYAIEPMFPEDRLTIDLHENWADAVARLCIGLRRLGTGGTLLITPHPTMEFLDVKYPLTYKRLRDSVFLGILEKKISEYFRKSIA